jgi:nicotinamidase-related amidase
MSTELQELLQPATTAVITVECQRGVIGPNGPLPVLVETIRESGLVARVAALLDVARSSGAPVLHGTVVRRTDGGGVTMNCRLFTAVGKSGAPPLLAGSEAAALVPELGPGPNDWIVPRYHGVSLFHDTELDAILRSLGVKTVVLLGASLNIAIVGTTIEAVNRGYRVVVPEDGVVGIPTEYGEAVLRNSMRLLATITRCDDVAAAFRAHARA